MAKLKSVMFNFHERAFKNTIQDCVRICLVAKSLIDKTLFFRSHLMLGVLYLKLDFFTESRQVFDLIKDVSDECHNWGQAMQAYEWIGHVLSA